MNLPSIFKSAPVMKGSVQTPGNNKINNNVPQDMFGLGIQVFKIQSRKQIQPNTKSVGKMARQEIKAIENPVRRTSNIPQVPKPKKISAVLPSITRAPSQKQYKFDSHIKTDSIVGRKSVERTNRTDNKMDEIKQYNPPQTSIGKNVVSHKSKTVGTGKPANKSMDAVPEVQKIDPLSSSNYLIKEEWIQQLNNVRHFLTQARQFHMNETSKVGRRKNQEYLGQQTCFIDAYVSFEGTQYTGKELYDPYSIQNYKISSKGCHFQETHYEDHVNI